MAKKRSTTASSSTLPDDSSSFRAPADAPLATTTPTAAEGDDELIRINTANLSEVKNALDDAVKKFLSSPSQSYTPSHRHSDIKLALGWSAALIALATVAWSTRVSWEESKPPLTVAVIAYVVLSTIQQAYVYFVEKGCIFVGKRKALVNGRIETSNISITSKTSLPKPARTLVYTLSISSSRSTNAGKSLLSRINRTGEKGVGELFDESGVLSVKTLNDWVVEIMGEGPDGTTTTSSRE